uniref:Uncharacterized protein n=1 Tax=Alexandrium monilatum TaxID=311494 RepID=A0A7S4QS80_9DINO
MSAPRSAADAAGAKPAPAAHARPSALRRRSSTPDAQAESLQKAVLLGWLARLRYLHSACGHPLLQALALSLWTGGRGCCQEPPLQQLLEGFDMKAVCAEAPSGSALTPLLLACRAAQQRRGHPNEVAVCFVALCRALDIPARLVLAFDAGSTSAPRHGEAAAGGARAGGAAPRAGAVRGPAAGAAEPSAGRERQPSPKAAAPPAGKAAAGPSAEQGHQPRAKLATTPSGRIRLGKPLSADVRKLVGMGFDPEASLAAVLQSSEEGGSQDCFVRALRLLMDYGRSLGPRPSRRESSSGRQGGRAAPEAPAPEPRPAASQTREPVAAAAQQEEAQAVVSVWPEAWDCEAGRWVAVDTVSMFLARDPVVEWIHRGTPMLWVCAADDGLLGGEHCALVDVTQRYSPSWHRVQEARGSLGLQRWWEEAIVRLSSMQPVQPRRMPAAAKAGAKGQAGSQRKRRRGADEPAPAEAGGKPRPKSAKLRALLVKFGSKSEELRGWLRRRGFLPWQNSRDKRERALAQWVQGIREAHAGGHLSPEQVEALECMKGWTWQHRGGRAGGAGRQKPAAKDDASASDEEQGLDSHEAWLLQWLRLTMQRLAAELMRQPSPAARRARLRQWQLSYHPDKNPGRGNEVMPIFCWVQSCWNQEFRSAELWEPPAEAPCPGSGGAGETASSPAAAPLRPALPSSDEGGVGRGVAAAA